MFYSVAIVAALPTADPEPSQVSSRLSYRSHELGTTLNMLVKKRRVCGASITNRKEANSVAWEGSR